jgi:hypothetical protein
MARMALSSPVWDLSHVSLRYECQDVTVSSAARYCPDRDVVGIVHKTKSKLNTHMFALIIFIVAKINK